MDKEVIVSRYALCMDEDVARFAGGAPTGKTPQQEFEWAAHKVRQYMHDVGTDISDDKAQQLLSQAQADNRKHPFSANECKQYGDDLDRLSKGRR